MSEKRRSGEGQTAGYLEVVRRTGRRDPDLGEMADAEELLSTGLLFEVNRRVLHPFGLALAVETRGGRAVRISPRLVRTTDPGGMTFTDEDLADGLRICLAHMKRVGFARLARRLEVHGWRAQVEPDVNPDDERDWSPAAAKLALEAKRVVDAAREVLEATLEANAEAEAVGRPATLSHREVELFDALVAYDGVEDDDADDDAEGKR